MYQSSLRVKDMTYIALMAVLITVCSWISIPAPVPFSLQTFAVFFALLALGGRRGMLSVCVYLVMGAVGLPVFTGFQGGLGVLAGPTGGYILGFVMMAVIYRLLAEKGGEKRSLAALVLGLAVCYGFGACWYVGGFADINLTTLNAALALSVYPFILPDLGKLALAVYLARRLKKHME
ncbi:MAG: biotin transporter BioY [Oscillibacter sp.]|nr:biotin transporter BioY [Oscillibacter sp.]